MLVSQQSLEKRWYDSLRNGMPDYAIYADDYFVADAWACWVVYSRATLRAVSSRCILQDGTELLAMLRRKTNSLVDLGCGIGYTTAMLAELFPGATVFGTNLEQTLQYDVAKQVGRIRNFTMIPSLEAAGRQIDLVVASEYFEHFERPIEHLAHILTVGKPLALIIVNSFGAHSIGHFDVYIDGNETISCTQIGRRFNAMLRRQGYRKIETGFWNNRPAVWVSEATPVSVEATTALQ